MKEKRKKIGRLQVYELPTYFPLCSYSREGKDTVQRKCGPI